jgi:hypothetical protein
MNRKEVINKIKSIFGFYGFGMYKTKEGSELRMEKLEMGMPVYIISPEGEFPLTDGDYELEDGTKVKVKEGMVSALEIANLVEDAGMSPEQIQKRKEGVEKTEEAMATATLIDGTIVGNDSDELQVGDDLFVLTEDGRQPAPDAVHETDTQMLVETEDGKIKSIKPKPTEVEMTEAKTPSGEVLSSPTFDVGETLDVVSDEGMKPAADGEYQVELKDTEGNEVKIRVIAKDGKIVERSNVEGDSAALSDLMEAFSMAVETLSKEIKSLKDANAEMKEKFSKFSSEPAAPKLLDRKGFSDYMMEEKFSKLERIAQLKKNKY